ncbi:MAG: cation transporter [Bdellovibrionales bacterium]|nr:cation transporter [Bdellovibrionales bacterium]
MMLFKFWGYSKSGSQAVFSDAMESIVNVIAAGLALFVVYYSAKPVDEDHPYGHGKIEFFSAAFEGDLFPSPGFLLSSKQFMLWQIVKSYTIQEWGLSL